MFFVVLFTLEMVLKMYALGFQVNQIKLRWLLIPFNKTNLIQRSGLFCFLVQPF